MPLPIHILEGASNRRAAGGRLGRESTCNRMLQAYPFFTSPIKKERRTLKQVSKLRIAHLSFILTMIFALNETSLAGQYRTVGYKTTWNNPEGSIHFKADYGNGPVETVVPATLDITGSYSDSEESSGTLQDLEAQMKEKYCAPEFAPRGKATLNQDLVSAIGRFSFSFDGSKKSSAPEVSSFVFTYLAPGQTKTKDRTVHCGPVSVPPKETASPQYFELGSTLAPDRAIEIDGTAPMYFRPRQKLEISFEIMDEKFSYSIEAAIESLIIDDKSGYNRKRQKVPARDLAAANCDIPSKDPEVFSLNFDTLFRSGFFAIGKVWGRIELKDFHTKANAVAAVTDEVEIEGVGHVHPVLCP